MKQYVESVKEIQAEGAELVALTVNDHFTVSSFGEALGAKEGLSFIADGNGDLTKALGLDLDLSAV